MKREIEEMAEQLRKEQIRNKEMSIKLNSLENRLNLVTKPKGDALLDAEQINESLKKRIDVYGQQQKKILENLTAIKDRHNSTESWDNAYHRAETKGYFSSTMSLEKIINRLKTTSPQAEKYAEVLDLIHDLYKTVYGELKSNTQNQYGVYDRVREKENEKILKTIKEEGLYKFYLKALCSNNRKVIISAQNLIFELGEYEERYQLFHDTGAAIALGKNFKLIEDPLMRRNCANLLQSVAQKSQEICQELANLNIQTLLSQEIIRCAKGASIVSDYFEHVIKLAGSLLKHNLGVEELEQAAVSEAIFFALRGSDSVPVQKAALLLIPFLTQTKEQRVKLYENDAFSSFWDYFIDAFQGYEQDIKFRCLIALSHFTNDENVRLLYGNSNQAYKLFNKLADCMDKTKYLSGPARLAAVGIASRMARLPTNLKGLKTMLAESGLMPSLIRAVADEELPIRKEAVTALINLEEAIPGHAEELEYALENLLTLISSKDEESVVLALQYMNMLSTNLNLLKKMIQMGMVSVISSFVINDPAHTSPEVIVNAGNLLIRLEDEPDARAQLLKNGVFYSFLPLVTFHDKRVREFWFDAMADLCNHREFRAQLEAEPDFLKFIKKSLDVLIAEKFDEECFILRVLFQSRLLLQFFLDDVTCAKLFDFYRMFLKDATQEYCVYALETLDLISQIKEGRDNMMKNMTMLEIIVLCMQKEDQKVAYLAGRIILTLLTETRNEDQQLLKTTALPEAAVAFAHTTDIQCKSYAYNILLHLLKDDGYATRLAYLGIHDAGDVQRLIDKNMAPSQPTQTNQPTQQSQPNTQPNQPVNTQQSQNQGQQMPTNQSQQQNTNKQNPGLPYQSQQQQQTQPQPPQYPKQGTLPNQNNPQSIPPSKQNTQQFPNQNKIPQQQQQQNYQQSFPQQQQSQPQQNSQQQFYNQQQQTANPSNNQQPPYSTQQKYNSMPNQNKQYQSQQNNYPQQYNNQKP